MIVCADEGDTAGGSGQACNGGLRLYESIAKSLGVDLCATGVEQHSVREFSMAALRGDYRRLIVRPRFLRHVFVKHSSVHDDIVSEGLVAPNISNSRAGDRRKGRPSQVEKGNAMGDCAEPAADSKAAKALDPMACEDAAHSVADQKDGGSATPLTAADECHSPAPLLENAYSAEDGFTVDMQDKKQVAVDDGKEGHELLSLVMSFALPSSCYATMLLRELLKGSTATEVHKQAYAEAEGTARGLEPGAIEEDSGVVADAAGS